MIEIGEIFEILRKERKNLKVSYSLYDYYGAASEVQRLTEL